jgi:hypothetical protein
MAVVEDFVKECPVCQKHRHGMAESLVAPVRRLEPESARHYCGYDTIYVTPATKEGYKYLHHVRLLPARLSALYLSIEIGHNKMCWVLYNLLLMTRSRKKRVFLPSDMSLGLWTHRTFAYRS